MQAVWSGDGEFAAARAGSGFFLLAEVGSGYECTIMANNAAASRLAVPKTLKLFIGGKFPRTESGRVLTAAGPRGAHLAHYCQASKKDLRDAVVAARKAAPGWAGSTAYLRSQIIYRLAEMLESRAGSLTEELAAATGQKPAAAAAEVSAAVDLLVHLAGWPDKLPQLFGSVNPVAAPYFNFSALESQGVMVLFAPDAEPLLGAVALIGAALTAGNACVLVASDRFPTPAISLAEAIATSDVPGGAVNILTGRRAELSACAAEHHDIDGIVDASGDAALGAVLQAGAAVNLKRVQTWPGVRSVSPYQLLAMMETKTTWHPVGG
jgi:acyl-CoA reductase-like NAD-dependent aldehyde dehydrogenase